jgi:hypothetical protein
MDRSSAADSLRPSRQVRFAALNISGPSPVGLQQRLRARPYIYIPGLKSSPAAVTITLTAVFYKLQLRPMNVLKQTEVFRKWWTKLKDERVRG